MRQRTKELARRANGAIATQFVSETHDHKPDVLPKGVVYSTANQRHTKNHPDAEAAALPAYHLPANVNVWNVESYVAVSSNAITRQVVFVPNRELWESIGRPGRVDVSGSPETGYVIAWGDRYTCQVAGAKRQPRIYVTASRVSLPAEGRARHVLRACSRGGQIEIEQPHRLWVAGDPAFDPSEEVRRDPRSGALCKVPPPTTPQPRARPPGLPIPTPTDFLKAELKAAIDKVVELKGELERKTGLRFRIVTSAQGGVALKLEV